MSVSDQKPCTVPKISNQPNGAMQISRPSESSYRMDFPSSMASVDSLHLKEQSILTIPSHRMLLPSSMSSMASINLREELEKRLDQEKNKQLDRMPSESNNTSTLSNPQIIVG